MKMEDSFVFQSQSILSSMTTVEHQIDDNPDACMILAVVKLTIFIFIFALQQMLAKSVQTVFSL
jgi:hypothetical protein